MAGTKNKSDKKDRSRKSPQNSRYKAERRHEKSHIKRLKAHLLRQPSDKPAKAALERYKIAAGVV